MGETKKKPDLEWMIHFCEPTPSQQQSLLHCPFARESEIFDDSLLMSSLGPTQPDNPDHILMLSLPESTKPTQTTPDVDVFVTPPENQFRSESDSDRMKRVRVSDDEAQSKKFRAESDSQLECTEPIDSNNNGVKTDVVVLDGSDESDNEEETVNLADDSVEITRDNEEQPSQNTRDLGSSKMDQVGSENVVVETSNVRVVEEVVDNGRVNKDVSGEGTSRNGFEEIDKFAYNGNGKQGRRKLPESMRHGDEEDNDVVEKEKEVDFYDVLKVLGSVVGDGDEEEVNFVETAKKRGVVFPRPRWWHPDW